MVRAFALLFLLVIAPAALAAGYQEPTLLPLIHDLEKTQRFIEKRVDPAGLERVSLPSIPRHNMRGLTSKKHPQVFYNLRRVEVQNGELRDTLYAVLPDVTEESCATYKNAGHGSGKPYVVSPLPINIAPNRFMIMVDPGPFPAGVSCIQTPDKRLLFMMALATRVKKAGQDGWVFAATP